MTPKRIQRRRSKGWRKPEGAVVVSRPGKWGNPEKLTDDNRQQAVASFEASLLSGQLRVTVDDVRRELAGKDLCCWCPLNQACHADVLLRVANMKNGAL